MELSWWPDLFLPDLQRPLSELPALFTGNTWSQREITGRLMVHSSSRRKISLEETHIQLFLKLLINITCLIGLALLFIWFHYLENVVIQCVFVQKRQFWGKKSLESQFSRERRKTARFNFSLILFFIFETEFLPGFLSKCQKWSLLL